MNTLHPTVILGGGFVGLFTALHLRQQNYSCPVILIDQRDRFTFKPLLYELLTGELHAEQICPSYTDLLSGKGIRFMQDGVQSVDLEEQQIVLASGQTYDYAHLVVALGSQTTYFKTIGAAEQTLPFTTAAEAINLRHHLKARLAQARQTQDLQERLHLLTVAIIGAGPAGVELACTLADILPVWYDELGGDYDEPRLVLVNRGSEILKGDINSRLRDHAKRSLASRTVAVELLTDAAVTEISTEGIAYTVRKQPEFLFAKTVVWTGGTEPHPFLNTLPVPPEQRDLRGRLQVLPTLQLPKFPEVFIGGDCAYLPENPQPPTAQVAYQQGKTIAGNLMAIEAGKPPKPAQVHLRGTLMKLGVGEGVANVFDRLIVPGEVGHLIREATYLELLPTPVYNLKATAEWLTDELLQRHQPRSLHPEQSNRTPVLAGTAALFAGLIISMPLIWRAAQPEQFQKHFTWTGVPTLLNQLAPKQSTHP